MLFHSLSLHYVAMEKWVMLKSELHTTLKGLGGFLMGCIEYFSEPSTKSK
jgi:hypothetical protein